jgi:hypothetical protein
MPCSFEKFQLSWDHQLVVLCYNTLRKLLQAFTPVPSSQDPKVVGWSNIFIPLIAIFHVFVSPYNYLDKRHMQEYDKSMFFKSRQPLRWYNDSGDLARDQFSKLEDSWNFRYLSLWSWNNITKPQTHWRPVSLFKTVLFLRAIIHNYFVLVSLTDFTFILNSY